MEKCSNVVTRAAVITETVVSENGTMRMSHTKYMKEMQENRKIGANITIKKVRANNGNHQYFRAAEFGERQ